MAVPESEEVGFKRIASSPCVYNASVPIKKRRFPLMQSPPSPSKVISSFHLDGTSIKNEQLNLSECSTVSNTGIVTTSELSNKKKDSISEENKGKSNLYDADLVQSNIGDSRVRFQEPSVRDHVCFNGSEEKSAVSEKFGVCASLERPGLKLSSTNQASDPRTGIKEEEIDRNKPEEKCKDSICQVKERAELSVGLKGHIVSNLVPEKSDWNYLKQESMSGDLSLSEQGSGSRCITGNPKSDYDGSLLRTNREKWDLNTSMESWEVCARDAPAVPISVVPTNTTVETDICSNEMLESDTSPSGKQALVDSEHKPNFFNARGPSNDLLHLSLSSYDPKPIISQERNSSIQLDLDLGKANPNFSLSTKPVQFDDLNVVMKVEKLVPFGDGSKLDLKGGKSNGLGLFEDAIVKRELDEPCSAKPDNSLKYCSLMKVVEPKSVKSESVCDNKHETLKTLEGTFKQAVKHVLTGVADSCLTAMPVMAEMTGSARNPSCSTDLTVSSHSEQLTPIEEHLNGVVHQGGCGGGGLVNSEMINISKEQGSEDSNISVIKTSKGEHENVKNPECCPLKLMNEQHSGLQGSGESSVSDAEKINISADMLEEESYGSEYESDGNQDFAKVVDADGNNIEEDYEDGEVREPILETEVEDHACEKREVERFDHGDFDKKINSVGLPGHDCFNLDPVEQEIKSENLGVRSEDGLDTLTRSKYPEQENENLCEKELHSEENIVNNSKDVNRLMKTAGRSQFSQYDNKNDSGGQDSSSNKVIDGIQESVVTSAQAEVETSITVDVVQNNDLTLPNVKESVNSDDASRDVNGGSRHSRIINLARSSTDSSPCKTKSNFIRSVLSRTDRELVPDIALDEANLQPRGRDDTYSNINKKFSVDRHQDQSSWMNFNRRGGRSGFRLDTRQRDWNFRPNFSPEIYSNHTDYRGPSHKYVSAHSDADLDQNRYKTTPEGSFGGTNHRGRQVLDDGGPFFPHGPSRRRSPGRRHGPHVRGGKIVNRVPRDFSPNTCMDEGGSEFDGQQHGDKFTRNFADETMDPIYARPQPPYEVDRPFFRERKNFSFQRKGFPRFDSKSPVRTRARSPGQWFSMKRPDRFCDRPEMTRRKSPNHRMRSPDQRSIRGHMPAQRHGFRFLSPPSNNDLRDNGIARRGHMRPFIPNRNQTDRPSFRNRRYDVIDPRGRMESDEFFDGPVHSGRLNEHIGVEHDDVERRFNEFQPPYNNDFDGDRFHNNEEHCSRPFRFCAENDSRS